MGLRDILIENKIYETEIYGHKWKVEVCILSEKAKNQYNCWIIKGKKIDKGTIEIVNITEESLREASRTLFINGVKNLSIDGEDEKVDNETFEYLYNKLGLALEWIENCIKDFNGNFFLMQG